MLADSLAVSKYLDAQIHLTREREHGIPPPESPEVKWSRGRVAIYLHVMAYGIFPNDETDVMWVKNQRRGSLCDYQIADTGLEAATSPHEPGPAGY